ncbi:MAG: hypothetical protein WD065_19155, partial [Planctomycetaceae bacterium]
DTTSISARFFALNCAQSVVFCRFWWFFGVFALQMRPHPAFGPLLPVGEGFRTRAKCAATRISLHFRSIFVVRFSDCLFHVKHRLVVGDGGRFA